MKVLAAAYALFKYKYYFCCAQLFVLVKIQDVVRLKCAAFLNFYIDLSNTNQGN